MKNSSSNVLPGWMILILDALIYFNACIFGFLIFTSYHHVGYSPTNFLLATICFTGFGLLASYLLNNHSINHEDNIANETVNIIKTTLLALTFFIISQVAILKAFDINLYYGSIGFISLICCLTIVGILALRLIIRKAVEYLNNQNAYNKKFLIIGNDATAKISRSVLQNLGYPLQFIQAYLTENPAGMGKKIHNAPIYNEIGELDKILKTHNITDIVLSAEVGPIDQKRSYIDESLKNGIRPSILKPKDPWAITKVNGLSIRKILVEDYLAEDQSVLNDLKLYQYINQQTILIAGGAGSIGQEICRQLLYLNPSHLVLLDQAEDALVSLEKTIKKLRLRTTISSVVMDIRDKSKLEAIFKKYNPQIVYHTAFYSDTSKTTVSYEDIVKTYVQGTKNLADLSKDFQVDRFILVSSEQAVSPNQIIGASRRMAELYIHQSQHQPSSHKKTKFIIVRHGEILGVNDKLIQNIKREIRLGEVVNIHHPQSIKSFTSLPETGKFILTSSILGHGGETYILQKKNTIKLVDLVKKIIQLDQVKINAEVRIYYDKHNQPIIKTPSFNSSIEYLLPTTYSDIFLAVPLNKNYIDINEKIDLLQTVLKEEDEMALIKFFKGVIPDFTSNNKFIELSYRMN